MSNFNDAIDFVLQNEGGLSNDPHDAGGLTNYGISQRVYPNVDIKNLTRDRAKEIYEKDYWHYDGIHCQKIATKLLDAAVNMGPVRAVRLIQLSLGAIEAGPVIADGVFGSHTADAINAADPDRLMDEYKAQLAKYYCDQGKPEFILGWLRRAVKG